ncbi:MAG: hypothetical protein RMJ45_00580 [Candidatus Calescibacterium sp.]|nr:hypothetical protein [Candidatus Calescibacterium sp.]
MKFVYNLFEYLIGHLDFLACPYCAADNAARSNSSITETILTGAGVLVLFLFAGGFILFYTVGMVRKKS